MEGDLFRPPKHVHANICRFCICIIGSLFNVEKGWDNYASGSYFQFTQRDNTIAFTNLKFGEEEDNNDVLSLKASQMKGVSSWWDFYNKTYPYYGVHIGRFFDERGDPTQYMLDVEKKANRSFRIPLSKVNISTTIQLPPFSYIPNSTSPLLPALEETKKNETFSEKEDL